jgi:hypothetical protein
MVDSDEMKALFTPADWSAIMVQVKPLPRISDTVTGHLTKFRQVYILLYEVLNRVIADSRL